MIILGYDMNSFNSSSLLILGMLIYIKGLLFRLHDVNDSLVNIREAVEDLPDQEGDSVKKLRRMVDRMKPVSGWVMRHAHLIFLNKQFQQCHLNNLTILGTECSRLKDPP